MELVLMLSLLPFIGGVVIGLAIGLSFNQPQPRDERGRFVKATAR